MTAVLEADRLYRFFHAGDEEVLALQGVSLAVRAGEMVAVMGPSGSGKSTLLACLAGLDEPDGGTVRIAGERLSRRTETERAALRAERVGMLFQTSNLIEHLNVEQNVELVQVLAGARDRARRDRVLEAVGLLSRRKALPSELSGGEAARAGLAVALANEPPVILADEPTGEVDSGNEVRLISLLRERASAGAAVLVVTHSEGVAAAADRVVRLLDGKVTDVRDRS